MEHGGRKVNTWITETEMVNSGMFWWISSTQKWVRYLTFTNIFLAISKVRMKIPYSEPSHNNRENCKIEWKSTCPSSPACESVSFKFVLQPNYNLLHVRDLQFVQGHPNCKIGFTEVLRVKFRSILLLRNNWWIELYLKGTIWYFIYIDVEWLPRSKVTNLLI